MLLAAYLYLDLFSPLRFLFFNPGEYIGFMMAGRLLPILLLAVDKQKHHSAVRHAHHPLGTNTI